MFDRLYETYWMMLQFEAIQFFNSFIYYLAKVPLLKKIVKPENYSFPKTKSLLKKLLPIYKVIRLFLGALISYYLVFYLALTASGFFGNYTNIETVVFFLYFTHALNNFFVLKSTEIMYYFQHIFRFQPRQIARVNLFFDRIFKFFFRTLVFSIFLPNSNNLQAVGLSLILLVIASVIESIHLLIFKKYRKDYSQKSLVVLITVLFSLGLAGLAIFLKFNIANYLNLPLLLLVSFVLLAITFWQQWNYTLYPLLARESVRRYEEMLVEMESLRDTSTTVKLKDKDLTEENISETEKDGFNLLNRLFFKRHFRVLYKPVLIKSAIVLVIGIVLTAVLIYSLINTTIDATTIPEKSTLAFSYVPFIMYILCNGEQVSKAMFINCDISLFKYPFYIQPNNILALFKLRIKSLIKWNAMPTLLMMLFVLIWGFVIGGNIWTNVLVLEIMILSLGIFFSVHTLFVYYIFQPYNEDYKIKNPIYSIINWVIYLVCFSLFQIGVKSFWIAPSLILITLLYSLVALWAVHKYAIKTFRIH